MLVDNEITIRNPTVIRFEPPEHLVILQTENWVLNHRVGSALPGYLMLGARTLTNDLSRMRPEALAELGMLLARAQKALNDILAPRHLYIGRYGHIAGHSLHFHIIPVCEWVRQSFFGDPRYRVLQDLSRHSAVAGPIDETDGAELTFYVWREFCENPVPPKVFGPTVPEVVERLKACLSDRTF
jgi:diadenosine tetraphosphate (Ap4A) HIT family hydrolase